LDRPVLTSASTPLWRKMSTAAGESLSAMSTRGMAVSFFTRKEWENGRRDGVRRAQSPAAAVSKAQSSQGVRASRSAVSTVAPHQMRRPGGASR